MQPSGTNSTTLRGFAVQLVNIRALMIRDMMMRYGRDGIGFVWAIVEPMLLCVGVMVLWNMLGISKKAGVNIVELVLTGYMPLTLWRHMTGNAIKLFRGSTSLLYHRRISLFDIFIARQFFEFIVTSIALFTIWSILYSFGVVKAIADLDMFLLGWFMMGWFSIVSAAGIAALTEVSEAAERFIAPLQYLNLPLSGSFYFIDWLPEHIQEVAMYHPHVHVYEVFRAGYFGASYTPHYDLLYFSATAFFMTFVGVVCISRIRGKLQLT